MLGFNCSMKLVSHTGVDQGSINLLYTKPISQVTAVIYVWCNVQSVSQSKGSYSCWMRDTQVACSNPVGYFRLPKDCFPPLARELGRSRI